MTHDWTMIVVIMTNDNRVMTTSKSNYARNMPTPRTYEITSANCAMEFAL